MTVLVTGAGGQVGREILRLAPPDVTVIGLDRRHLDVTDAKAVRAAVREHAPDTVIHAAAYTAVDRAQAEPERAMAVNGTGTANLAEACAECGVGLVALSTDYVFDGAREAAYRPGDSVSPVNVYGASKARGEAAALAAGGPAVVLRTAWVFSAAPGNFASTILRLAGTAPRLRVVADQWGHPTPAGYVAQAALAAASRVDALPDILQVAGAPLVTWHDLATELVEAASAAGLCPQVPVDPVTTEAYGAVAPRPRRVELDMTASLEALGMAPVDWRDAIPPLLQRWSSPPLKGTAS
ncbi:dTDP-4-dehydrorhamnose reductase [Rubrivirga sp. IMCC43871]|uniref:dTDP-4-dehydrorhamnose reductase n=1 Tax=Rubrivirga sp. IMCC43871 TaxID=3391575 RepID=UPI0039903907